jgi:hypothetical protein
MMRKTLLSAAALVLSAVFHLSYGYQSDNPQKFRLEVVRIDSNIQLTGKLSDPLWRLANTAEVNYEMQPGENNRPAQKTTVRVLYNSDYIYFGFVCKDTKPSEIRAHVTDRDKIFEDDYVGVVIDTYGDNQRAYELFVNPFGIQGDLMRMGNQEDDTFDCMWQSAAAINDTGWTAEVAVPFKSLRFQTKKEQNWIALLGRIYPRSSRYVFSWTPEDRNNPCFLCKGGTLTGIKDIEGISSFEVLPYVAGFQSSELENTEDPSPGMINGPIRGRIGGGIKYSPNPTLVLDAVVNPDFSQVESDADQISVNTTFALFYPEGRPFFLEGAEMFSSLINGFYSRMINNPLGAAKSTGKLDGLSYAYLGALDRDSPFIVPGMEGSSFVSTPLRSFSNVFRSRYDMGSESHVGALITARNYSEAHNYLGGLDWNLLFWGNFYFRGQILYSDTKEINDTSLFSDKRTFGNTGHTAAFDGEDYSGTGLTAEFTRSARDYSFEFSYTDISPTFQSQNGFINNNDQRHFRFENSYSFYPESSIVDRGNLVSEIGIEYNYSGGLRERWMVVGGEVQLKSQTDLYIGFMPVNEEIFRNAHFRDVIRVMGDLNSRPFSFLSIFLEAEIGKFIYRADSPGLGKGHNLTAAAVIRPSDKIQIDLSYSRASLWDIDTGELFYDGYIARTVGVYQFSSELYVRVIGQYNSFDRSVQVYPLISYKLNPFTIFYIGATNDLVNYGTSYGVRQTARQFFLKIQHLWQS